MEIHKFWQKVFLTWIMRGESTAVSAERADIALQKYKDRFKESGE